MASILMNARYTSLNLTGRYTATSTKSVDYRGYVGFIRDEMATTKSIFQQSMMQADWRFFNEVTAGIDVYMRLEIASGYEDRFMQAYNNEPIAYKKANAGRTAANNWLRSINKR
jgi:hypothetical protein